MTAASGRDLNDDVVTEILLRLPSVAVLRSRAVCKAWHRITSSPAFIAAHARRRPLELIVQRHGPSGALETTPLVTLDDEATRRCLRVQYPEYTSPAGFLRGYNLIASCDGLLLFQRLPFYRDYLVCNPVTRQWTMLPRPPCNDMLPCGFYIHGPSGEHRVLCLTGDQGGSHYVCSLEAGQARRLGQAIPVIELLFDQPIHHVNHHGRLHWLRHPEVLFSTDTQRPRPEETGKRILAFDTVSETFRRIRRPPRRRGDGRSSGESFFLLEMDGMLAMTDFLRGSMDLWLLTDYNDDESWTLRLRVDLLLPRSACWAMNAGMAERQNVILLGDYGRSWVGLYDVVDKRMLQQIQLAPDDLGTRLNELVFRDSLARHAFFDLRH